MMIVKTKIHIRRNLLPVLGNWTQHGQSFEAKLSLMLQQDQHLSIDDHHEAQGADHSTNLGPMELLLLEEPASSTIWNFI